MQGHFYPLPFPRFGPSPSFDDSVVRKNVNRAVTPQWYAQVDIFTPIPFPFRGKG
jgi:hypothetical protein